MAIKKYVRIEEWKVVERRDGCVYKTRYARDWYIPLGAKFPEDSGDVRYAPTSDRNLYDRADINKKDLFYPEPDAPYISSSVQGY